MWGSSGKDDVESGSNATEPLYPTMNESPELRWAFIRKIYTILSIQLLLTIAVGAVMMIYRPIPVFLLTTVPGIFIYVLMMISPIIILCPLFIYRSRHPVNLILLAIFTLTLALAVGISCSLSTTAVVLEAVILTATVVVSLTAYTFWAAKRGHDFQFLRPFLYSSLMILIVFSCIQVFFPMGSIGSMIYGGVSAIVFCAYILYDTDNLIKRYSYDEYVWAAVALYLDILNLFLSILSILGNRRR